MKRLFTIITLLMSSFFLFSINEVRAETYTYELTEDCLNSINDRFFSFREKVLEYVSNNNLEGYVIFYNRNQNYYRAYVTDDNYDIYVNSYAADNSILRIYVNNVTQLKLDNSDNLVVVSSITSAKYNNLLSSNMILDYYLDSNLELLSNQFNDYVINYNDLSYTISNGSTIPTLYEIYLDSLADVEPIDPYEEEKVIMNNFYTTIFTKISDLASSISTNFTFLVIFGIFILIFVFELIRRKFL